VIRLLLDQGLPRSTVDLLNRDGWDVVHLAQCGLSAAADEQSTQTLRLPFQTKTDRSGCGIANSCESRSKRFIYRVLA
jgi:hypothetical protein